MTEYFLCCCLLVCSICGEEGGGGRGGGGGGTRVCVVHVYCCKAAARCPLYVVIAFVDRAATRGLWV